MCLDKHIIKIIDHTLLRPTATEADVRKHCKEGKKFGFASVCVGPVYVPLATRLLKGTNVNVCTVVGFPLGFVPPKVKAFETERVLEEGAREVDVVINLGALKSGDYEVVKKDLRSVVKVSKTREAITKAIIEACYLTREEKVIACLIAEKAGVDFVKTSTGFGPRGASVRDVRLMRRVLSDKVGVKAAGGICTLDDVIKMVKAGASRIGTSHGVAIAKEVLTRCR